MFWIASPETFWNISGRNEMYQETLIANVRSFEDSIGSYAPRLADYFAHPENYRLAPFRIFGNLYYVGDQQACPYLIDTGEGLILIDTGYGHELPYLLENIRTLGFRVEDVKIIVHSHGHYDHFGGTEAIQSISGARVYMSRVDTQLLRQMPERGLVHLSCVPGAQIAWPDEELEDGDHIRLGNTDITCVLSPGHTFGTMSFFFDVTDGQQTLRVGYLGGAGFLTMYKAYCGWYRLPQTKCAAMKETIQKLWDEKVDITLGNHPPQNDTLGKRKFMTENPNSNPFINPDGWRIFLSALEAQRAKFEELGY